MVASNATALTPGPFMEFLGRVAYEASSMRPLLPTYAHLLVAAIFPIYVASHASLTRPQLAAKAKKRTKEDSETDNEEESDQKIESLTPTDAILFPLLAGGTLASLYFILKWLQDPAWLNWALGIYFSWVGLFFAFKFLKDFLVVVRSFVVPTSYSADGQAWTADHINRCYESDKGQKSVTPLPGLMGHLPLSKGIQESIWSIRSTVYGKAQLNIHIHHVLTVKTSVTVLDFVSLIAASSIVLYHTLVSKPWYLINFLGFSFCYGALQFTTPTTGWTGTLVLAALFFYDIYFVFFTPMMVTVATKLDVPIKLLFPRPDGCVVPVGAAEGSIEMEKYLECIAKKRTMAMLGLGDIVVPGMMIAFALRFDLYLHYLRVQRRSSKKDVKPSYQPATGGWGERFWTAARLRSDKLKAKSFKKTYFHATVFGYTAGMITTIVVMQVAEHAQPALLYLVPGVIGMFWGTAVLKGELKTLWNYSEAAEEEDKKNKDKDKDKKDAKGSGANGDREDEPAAEANGHIDACDAKVVSRKTNKKSNDPEASCHKLFEFSITLPDKVSQAQKLGKEEPAYTQDMQNAIKARDDVQDDEEQEESESDPPATQSRYDLRQSSIGVVRDGSAEPVVKRRRKV